jgi:hypothetical protein
LAAYFSKLLIRVAARCCGQIDWAVAAHDELLAEVERFFSKHDLLLCPTVMLPPFDATLT